MLKDTFYPIVFMTVALLMIALLGVPPALAVTFEVNSTLDEPDSNVNDGQCISTPSGKCTLRAAVMQANRTRFDLSDATIIVPAGIYMLTIPPAGAEGEENGDLNLTSPTIGSPVINIIGAGADKTIIDGNQLDRLFYVHSGRRANITGVTLYNGNARDGGCIYNNHGVLTVTNSTITGNRGLYGGGILNYYGVLMVINSTISSNDGVTEGGGIYNFGSSGTATVTNSFIYRNHGGYYGGGIFSKDSTLTVINSTIAANQVFFWGGGICIDKNPGTESFLTLINSTVSGNRSDGDGGGICNFGQADVYSSTITANGADYNRDYLGIGGGVYNFEGNEYLTAGIFSLRNTLVAGNDVFNAPVPDDCKGIINSYGVNLFSDFTGCTVINGVLSYSGYFTGGLGPLQDNGGPTWTHALLPDSNAIDGGDQVRGCIGPDGLLLVKDQRGAPRVAGIFQLCDIGAFEYGAKLPWAYLPLIIRN